MKHANEFIPYPPSTRPSPRREGESFAVPLKIRATGLVGRSGTVFGTNLRIP